MVVPLSRSSEQRHFPGTQTEQREGGVETVDGKFTLVNLPVGTETLKITHPEHCDALSSEIEIGTGDIEVKPIVMTRGGSVQGYVYNASGEPIEGAALNFKSRFGRDTLATAVTDQQGHYQVHHLPEELCYVVTS